MKHIEKKLFYIDRILFNEVKLSPKSVGSGNDKGDSADFVFICDFFLSGERRAEGCYKNWGKV